MPSYFSKLIIECGSRSCYCVVYVFKHLHIDVHALCWFRINVNRTTVSIIAAHPVACLSFLIVINRSIGLHLPSSEGGALFQCAEIKRTYAAPEWTDWKITTTSDFER